MKTRKVLIDSLASSNEVEGSLVVIGILLADIRDVLVDDYNLRNDVPIEYDDDEKPFICR